MREFSSQFKLWLELFDARLASSITHAEECAVCSILESVGDGYVVAFTAEYRLAGHFVLLAG